MIQRLKGSAIRIIDCDDGQNSMDVVIVPEGVSFQVAQREDAQYISVIVSPGDLSEMLAFLIGNRGKA